MKSDELASLEFLLPYANGRELANVERLLGAEALAVADPSKLLGHEPDPWQRAVLTGDAERILLLCSRQAGKSTTAAALALKAALLNDGSLVLLLSPTLRQSGELFRDKVLRLYNALGRPVAVTQETQLTAVFANGSRIISLPGEEQNIRGYSGVSLLVIDEAARCPDPLYYSVRPMLAVSRGRLVCLSTPFGKRGWFYDEWTKGTDWQRVQVRASQCPRISPEFLAEERRALGERWYQQEYETSFEDAVGQVFMSDDIFAAVDDGLRPMFGG